VLPLTADTSVDSSNLLGDGGRTVPANADPMTVRVLTTAIDPSAIRPRRRFFLPRPGSNANAERRRSPRPSRRRRRRQKRPRKSEKSDDAKNKVAPAVPAHQPRLRAGRAHRLTAAAASAGAARWWVLKIHRGSASTHQILSTACAAWRLRGCQTTSDWPRRMSPAVKTLSIEVW